MLRLLHISDLHFGPPYVTEVGEALQRLAADLSMDAVVISGDLTQRAKRHQFEQARDYLKRLPNVPQLVIPGNHDVPLYRVAERLFRPRELYCEIITEDLNPVMKVGNAILVGVDSTSPRRAISNGRIDVEQLDACRKAFDAAPEEAVRILVAHHQFVPPPESHPGKRMQKANRAIDCFVELGVDMILGGHLHRAYIGNSLDFYPGSHRDRGIIIVQCGTSTSSRGRSSESQKNTLNVIDVGQEMFCITHYMYFRSDDAFRPVSRHEFPRPGRRFSDDLRDRNQAELESMESDLMEHQES